MAKTTREDSMELLPGSTETSKKEETEKNEENTINWGITLEGVLDVAIKLTALVAPIAAVVLMYHGIQVHIRVKTELAQQQCRILKGLSKLFTHGVTISTTKGTPILKIHPSAEPIQND